MRILTFNLWHGLTPSSPVAFKALEPTGRRRLREGLQLQLLLELKPDICFFQEVNPVLRRTPVLAKALGMDFTFQPDLVGLKLLGVGLPLNLHSGLVTLAKPSFGLRKVAGVSLSRPGTNLVHAWGSWQLSEERFALFSEAMLPHWGRVLMINTHLHHGLEETVDFLSDLERLSDAMELSEAVIAELKSRLHQGNERRRQEFSVLRERLEKYQGRYEVVIVAGDFNASPGGELSAQLRQLDFRDVWQETHPQQNDGFTFDGVTNRANHLLQQQFPLTLVVEDLSFSNKTKDALLSLARKQEGRPRRIDYIWLRAHSLKLKVTQTQLFGHPDAEGLAPSDHFAVCTDVNLE